MGCWCILSIFLMMWCLWNASKNKVRFWFMCIPLSSSNSVMCRWRVHILSGLITFIKVNFCALSYNCHYTSGFIIHIGFSFNVVMLLCMRFYLTNMKQSETSLFNVLMENSRACITCANVIKKITASVHFLQGFLTSFHNQCIKYFMIVNCSAAILIPFIV